MENGINNLGYAPRNEKDVSAHQTELERKFARFGEGLEVTDGTEISGYASLFGDVDQGGDVVEAGAYAASLKAVQAAGRSIKAVSCRSATLRPRRRCSAMSRAMNRRGESSIALSQPSSASQSP